MLDDHSSLPIPAPLRAWADTLPSFAADVVSQSDTSQPHVYSQFSAAPDQVSVARSQITAWTRRLGLADVYGQDVVLATDEAVSNVIEHAIRKAH